MLGHGRGLTAASGLKERQQDSSTGIQTEFHGNAPHHRITSASLTALPRPRERPQLAARGRQKKCHIGNARVRLPQRGICRANRQSETEFGGLARLQPEIPLAAFLLETRSAEDPSVARGSARNAQWPSPSRTQQASLATTKSRAVFRLGPRPLQQGHVFGQCAVSDMWQGRFPPRSSPAFRTAARDAISSQRHVCMLSNKEESPRTNVSEGFRVSTGCNRALTHRICRLPVFADHDAGLDRQLHRGQAQGLAGDGRRRRRRSRTSPGPA